MTVAQLASGSDNCFVALGVDEPAVHDIDRRDARAQVRVFRGADGFEAAIREVVLERCRALARKAAPNEWYGVLVGRLCRDAAGRHVVVEGVVPDPEGLASPGFFKTTPESELRTRLTADALFPDCVLLGWVHSHPRGPTRFSSVDRENQKHWRAPDSLGVVVNPFGSGDIGAYRGPRSEPLRQVEDIPVDTALRALPAGSSPVPAPMRTVTENRTRSTRTRGTIIVVLGKALLAAMSLFAALSGALALHRTAALSTQMRHVEAEVKELSEPIVGPLDLPQPSDSLDTENMCRNQPPLECSALEPEPPAE